MQAVTKLQAAKGGGPCSAMVAGLTSGATHSIDNMLEHLGTLNIANDTKDLMASGKVEHLHIVNSVPSGALVNEEKVGLGANIT